MRELLRSRALWAMVAAGLVLRLWLAYGWYGLQGDVDSLKLVDDALGSDPLNVYTTVNPGFAIGDYVARHWPYPPGYFPWILASGELESTGLPFHGTISVLPILCELGIAVAVYGFLGARGASDRTRLLAAALVIFGPSFFAVTGFHGQIDAVTILPAVLALIVWERGSPQTRALWAGTLIGVGALVKWVPLFMLLALLPSVRSWREAATLVALPVAILALAILPFFAHDPDGVREAYGYAGQPGAGGLTLIVQPGISKAYLEHQPFAGDLNAAAGFLNDHGSLITLAGLALLSVFLALTRPAPLDAAVLVWLTVYVAGPSFSFNYAIWLLPFLLLAGYLRAALGFQLILLLPTIFWYDAFGLMSAGGILYPALMTLLWVAWAVALIILGRRVLMARRSRPEGGVLDPLRPVSA